MGLVTQFEPRATPTLLTLGPYWVHDYGWGGKNPQCPLAIRQDRTQPCPDRGQSVGLGPVHLGTRGRDRLATPPLERTLRSRPPETCSLQMEKPACVPMGLSPQLHRSTKQTRAMGSTRGCRPHSLGERGDAKWPAAARVGG